MKIRNISESGISRRDFLGKSGKAALSVLVGAGVNPKIAQDVIGNITPGSYIFLNHIDDSSIWYTTDVSQDAQKAWKGLKTFPKLLGINGSSNLVGYGDALFAGVEVDGDNFVSVLANMAKNGWDVLPDGDGFLLSKGSEEILVNPGESNHPRHTGSSIDWSAKIDSIGSFIKQWWENWGAAGGEPSSPNFRKMLDDHGIDFYDREGHVYEQIEEKFLDMNEYHRADFEKEYGNPKKWVQYAESKGVNMQDMKRELAHERYDVPDDYKLASPMHQPFESRLNKVLNIV